MNGLTYLQHAVHETNVAQIVKPGRTRLNVTGTRENPILTWNENF